MAHLFGKMPAHNSEFFVLRPLDMRGRKMESSSVPIKSPVHCFFFLTQGKALLSIGEESCFFKAEECATIPAGQTFAVRYFDNCTGFMGGFSPDFMQVDSYGKNIMSGYAFLRKWGAHKVLFDREHAQYVNTIFERLHAESSEGKNSNIIRAYLATLLTEIQETARLQDSENELYTENNICNKFIEDVFEKPDYSVSLDEYAHRLNISKNYLHKTVKRFTDKTPLNWITEAVILESKIMLSYTELTISEISSQVGIEDPSYFSRLFKKQSGMSPLQYRNSQKSINQPQ